MFFLIIQPSLSNDTEKNNFINFKITQHVVFTFIKNSNSVIITHFVCRKFADNCKNDIISECILQLNATRNVVYSAILHNLDSQGPGINNNNF